MITTKNPDTGDELVVHPWAHTDIAYYFQSNDGVIWEASDARGTNLQRVYDDHDAFGRAYRFDQKTNGGQGFPNLVEDWKST